MSSFPLTASTPREHRLLLLCARARQTAQQQQAFVSLLESSMNWKYVLPRMRRNGLMPLLMQHLQDLPDTETVIPNSVLQGIHLEFAQGLQFRLHLTAELKEVNQLLRSHDFRVLAYKGPTMALTAYGSMALRPFSDLDLLISPQDAPKVLALLEANGYEREHALALPPHLERKRAGADYEVALLPKDRYGSLDVHWKVAADYDLFPLTFEQMWERRIPSELDAEIDVLCREDLILCLCSHGIKHIWHRLEWISCLAALLETGRDTPLDWVAMESRAQALQCQRIFHLGLKLAIDLMEYECGTRDGFELVPVNVRRAIQADRVIPKLARQVWSECLDREKNAEISWSFSLILFSVLARDNWKQRAIHLYLLITSQLLPRQEDAVGGATSMSRIYLHRLHRILVRRLQRWGVLKRA